MTTKKNWLLIVALIALAAVYIVYFTDWFRPQTVQIYHAIREQHYRRHSERDKPVLIFGFNRTLRLTDVKVVPLAKFEKNSSVLPVWHLTSSSNSAPIKNFIYGRNIRGMKPYVAGAKAEKLETNVVYRLFITAGRIKGQQDFKLGS